MDPVDRRDFLKRAALAAGAVAVAPAACRDGAAEQAAAAPAAMDAPRPEPARSLPMPTVTLEPLGFPWATSDPFLFCAYHQDAYPAGNDAMGPVTPLAGRRLGHDFSRRDGWSMYHGEIVPGFPRHPHRGFETVTVAIRGSVDHSDSLGATARFGGGDAQWMTAGKGIVHAEMFPLRAREADNPLELFQVWLNLPAENKLVPPYFSMLWREQIPVHRFTDDSGKTCVVTTIAGALDGRTPPAPPPDSWASQPNADVAIWTLSLAPGARWTLPAAPAGVSRSLYVHEGDALTIGDTRVPAGHRAIVQADVPAPLVAGTQRCEVLMLQGRPIGEPVAHYGPFVMNTREELQQAFADYRADGFGGWPWRSDAPVHAREQERFAIHADGRKDVPG